MRRISRPRYSGMTLCCVMTLSLAPARLPAEEVQPRWWSDRGVLRSDVPPNDYAALNMGQLKNLAYKAWLEMETLPGGAGFLPVCASETNDYAAVTVGQLKETARPFCDRLGLSGHYPWSAKASAKDYAFANIGQAKHVFSFDPRSGDFDQDGMPDQWELAHDFEPCDGRDAAKDADSDGLGNLAEHLSQTHPRQWDTDGDGVRDGEDQIPTVRGPQITLHAPENNSVFASPDVLVSGVVSSTSGVDAVFICDAKAKVYALGDQSYAFTNVLRVEEGRMRITVRAASLGWPPLESRTNVTVTVDALPSDITILSPTDYASFDGAGVRVSVWTESTNDAVTVNGVATTRDGYVRYAWVVLPSLGTNKIQAVSVDEKGRPNTNSVMVVCSNLTYVDPKDADNDGVSDAVDPDPNNPSIRSSVRIRLPLNGTPIRY